MNFVIEVMTREPQGFGMLARALSDQERLGQRCAQLAALHPRIGVTISQGPPDGQVQSEAEWRAFLQELGRTIRAGGYPVIPWSAVAELATAPHRRDREARAPH